MTHDWIRRDALSDARAILARLADDATLVDPESDVRRAAMVVGRRAGDTLRATRQLTIVAAGALAVAGAAYLAAGLPGRTAVIAWALVIGAASGIAAAGGAVLSRLKARAKVTGALALIVEREDDWAKPGTATVGQVVELLTDIPADRAAANDPRLVVESRDGRRRKIRVSFETWETLRPGDVVTLWENGSEVVSIRRVASVDPSRNARLAPMAARVVPR